MILAKRRTVILLGALLGALLVSQCFNRIRYGQCMYRYVIPGCDYASYIRASGEILRGETPYYKNTNYIYTPLLAVVMIPFTWVSETTGYYLWTILSVMAFGYGAFRSGPSLRRF